MPTRLPRQHDARLALANELHARPFPELTAPCRAVQIAFKQPKNAAERDPEQDRAHLRDLLDRHGAPHPAPGADHWMGRLGRADLKWERHTEFVTVTLFLPGEGERPFDGAPLELLPRDWLDAAPGVVISASLVHVAFAPDIAAAETVLVERFEQHFVRESFAAALILGRDAAAGSDFRVHEDGMTRIAVVAPAFSADCIETLEEINEEIKESFEEAGGESFVYIPCLNVEPAHIEVLANIVQENLKGWID